MHGVDHEVAGFEVGPRVNGPRGDVAAHAAALAGAVEDLVMADDDRLGRGPLEAAMDHAHVQLQSSRQCPAEFQQHLAQPIALAGIVAEDVNVVSGRGLAQFGQRRFAVEARQRFDIEVEHVFR